MISKEAANALRKIVTGKRKVSPKTRLAVNKLIAQQKYFKSDQRPQPIQITPARHRPKDALDIKRIHRSYDPEPHPQLNAQRSIRITQDMIPMFKHTDMLNKIVDDIHQGKQVDASIRDIIQQITGDTKILDKYQLNSNYTNIPLSRWAYPTSRNNSSQHTAWYYNLFTWRQTAPHKHELRLSRAQDEPVTSTFYAGAARPSRPWSIPGLHKRKGYRGLYAQHEFEHTIANDLRRAGTLQAKLDDSEFLSKWIGQVPYAVKPSQVSRMAVQLGIQLAAIQKYIRQNPQLYTQFSPRVINKLKALPIFQRSKPHKYTGVPTDLHNLHKLVKHNPQLYGLFSMQGMRNLNMLRDIVDTPYIKRLDNDAAINGYRLPKYQPTPTKEQLNAWRKYVYEQPYMQDWNNTGGNKLNVLARTKPKQVYSNLLQPW